MTTRVNNNPFEVEIPALGGLIVPPGGVFDDPDDVLAGQEAAYPKSSKKPASPAAPTTTGEGN